MEKYNLGQFEEDLVKVDSLLANGIYSSSQDRFDALNIFAKAMKDFETHIDLLSDDDYYLFHNMVLMFAAVRKSFSSSSTLVPTQKVITGSFVTIANHPTVKEMQFCRKFK